MTDKKHTPHVRLRTILLIVNLMVFLLPLAGLMFFRVYENTLVQQTENELVAQAAMISAMYKAGIQKRLGDDDQYGIPKDDHDMITVEPFYTPIVPSLDLSKEPILPARVDGKPSSVTAPHATEVGEEITPLMLEAQRTTLSGMKVLDYNGVAVAGRNEIGMDFSDIHEIRSALRGHYTSVIRERISDSPPPALASVSRGTGIRVFIAMPVLHNGQVWGVVYLSRTPQNILKHMYAEKWKFIFVVFTLVCMTMIIALFTSFMISKPIKELIKRTERFSNGDKDALKSSSIAEVKEIALLGESFERMALSLNNRSEYIRDFAMHVSHEFKTPITAIQGSAELLLDHLDDMEESKKRQFLNNIIMDSNRLKRLVRRLLELARADNITPSNDVCTLSPILEHIKVRYRDVENFNVNIPPYDEMSVKISEENLETIFINLCDNAYQNNATSMDIAMRNDNGNLFITFADNGQGISKANEAKIFNLFFTTRKQEGGTGIGLGLVTSILDAHHGEITLKNSKKGAVFEILLPTSPAHNAS